MPDIIDAKSFTTTVPHQLQVASILPVPADELARREPEFAFPFNKILLSCAVIELVVPLPVNKPYTSVVLDAGRDIKLL